MSNHDRWDDAVGSYLLEAMHADERDAFEAHLAGCARCRAEVDELRPAAEAVPASAPQIAPPPALKSRIMAEVEREAELLRAAGPAADRPPAPRRRRDWRFVLPRAMAVAGVLLVGLFAGLALEGGTETWQGTVDRAQAPDATAELRERDGTAELVLEDMPAPPEGRVYQVWVLPEGADAPRPTQALFTPRRDGSAAAAVPTVDGVQAVLVTDEPAGGSPAPTREPVLTFSPS
jgi:anti-sigma-K factor RskA